MSPRRSSDARPTGLETGDEELARLIDEFAERLRNGESLDWPACLKQHPRYAETLQQLAPAIEALAKFGGLQRTKKAGDSDHEDP